MDGGFPKGIVKTIFKDVVKEIPERGESIGTKTCQTRLRHIVEGFWKKS